MLLSRWKVPTMVNDKDKDMLLSLLTLFFITFTIASAETIHISTDTVSCENTTNSDDVTCATLSQFALNTTSYVTMSDVTTITLTMEPGIHILDSTISISNVSVVELLGPMDDSMTISCNTTSSALVFEDISIVRIVNMTFKGCGGISVTSVEQLVVEDCIFSADGFEGAGVTLRDTNAHIMGSEFTMYSSGALSIVNDSELFVFDCTFYENQAEVSIGVLEANESDKHLTGGAINVHNSTMLISDTTLRDNGALLGGAIFADNSNITISNGTLARNIANFGGAIFAIESSVVITYGSYSNNDALYDDGSGGAVRTGMSTVSIESADFQSNTATYGGGSLCIYSSTVLTVTDVSFSDNVGTYGAAIFVTEESTAIVDNSTFLTNNATYGGALCTELRSNLTVTNSRLSNNTAEYGAGLYSESFSNVTMDGCLLTDNSVEEGGAGIYVNSTHFRCTNSEFSQNIFVGRLGYIFVYESEVEIGGESHFSDNCGSLFAVMSNVSISGDILFTGNNHRNDCDIDTVYEILHGGALSSVLSSIFILGNVIFDSNIARYGGALFSWESKLHIWAGETMITNNTALQGGGGMYLYKSMLEFRRVQCTFDNNSGQYDGGGINIVSSTINLYRDSHVVFTGNAARQGGAIYFELGSTMAVVKTNPFDVANVTFSENRANFGGALYITDDTNSGTCAAKSSSLTLRNLLATSECFFQILVAYRFTSVPNTLEKYFFFNNNSAIISGNSLFGGLLDRCLPNIYAEFAILNLNEQLSGTRYILESTNIQSEDISSKPVRLCFCENGEPNCNYVPTKPWTVTKGVTTNLPIVAVDQFNHTVNAYIISYLSQNDSRLGFGQNDQRNYGSCSDLQFRLKTVADTEELTLFATGPCGDIGISTTVVQIKFADCTCSAGFRVIDDSDVCACECGDELAEFLGGEDKCEIDRQNLIVRDSKFWMGSVSHRNECLAFFRYCPFDYCYEPNFPFITLDLNTTIITDSDVQCNDDRTGVLCGKCREGFSLALGSSRCLPNSKCTNNYLALIIVFAFAGVGLVAFIMLCNLTVAVGTLNGLIFYANIITNRTNVSQSITVNPLTIFIAWLNLDFGIETCFHQGLDGLAKVGWQFAFPLYVLLLVALVIVLCEYSQRFANFLSGKNPVATLATLILLSYVKFLRIIVDVFSPAKLSYICPDGSQYKENRWYYDGNVYFFDVRHIILFLAAMVVLIFGVVYTLILLTGQWFTRLPDHRGLKWLSGQKLNHFLEPYFAPYIPKHRYWTGLLLVARLLACIISTLALDSGLPQGNLFGITMIAGSLLLWKLVIGGRIYRHLLLDVLESLFLVFLIVYGDGTQFILAYEDILEPLPLHYSLASFALVIFVLILFYHGYTYVLRNTSIGMKFHKWITWKIKTTREWLKNISCWKRPRANTESEPKNEKPFTRGHSIFSLFHTLERSRKKRSQLKKSQLNKFPPVTYAMVDVVEGTPLSEELGHYTKKKRTVRISKQRPKIFGRLEESDERHLYDDDESVSEEQNDTIEHAVELDSHDGSNQKIVQVCVDLEDQEDDVQRRCDPNVVREEDDGIMEEEAVKREALENSTCTVLQPRGSGEEEREGFATSYKLISKDN